MRYNSRKQGFCLSKMLKRALDSFKIQFKPLKIEQIVLQESTWYHHGTIMAPGFEYKIAQILAHGNRIIATQEISRNRAGIYLVPLFYPRVKRSLCPAVVLRMQWHHSRSSITNSSSETGAANRSFFLVRDSFNFFLEGCFVLSMTMDTDKSQEDSPLAW